MSRLSFATLLGECRSRLEMIVTFLALLELLKLNRLVAEQSDTFGEIELGIPADEPAGVPASGGDDGHEHA